MNANFGGLRFVLIGDVSELPVLDMKIKPLKHEQLTGPRILMLRYILSII